MLNKRIREIEKMLSELQKEAADCHEWQALTLIQEAQSKLFKARNKTKSEQVELAKKMFGEG